MSSVVALARPLSSSCSQLCSPPPSLSLLCSGVAEECGLKQEIGLLFLDHRIRSCRPDGISNLGTAQPAEHLTPSLCLLRESQVGDVGVKHGGMNCVWCDGNADVHECNLLRGLRQWIPFNGTFVAGMYVLYSFVIQIRRWRKPLRSLRWSSSWKVT